MLLFSLDNTSIGYLVPAVPNYIDRLTSSTCQVIMEQLFCVGSEDSFTVLNVQLFVVVFIGLKLEIDDYDLEKL